MNESDSMKEMEQDGDSGENTQGLPKAENPLM